MNRKPPMPGRARTIRVGAAENDVCDARDPLVEALVLRRGQLVRAAARIVGCPRIAEDVVQTIALKLCEPDARMRAEEPHGYVRRMVRNAAIDAVRQMAGERRLIAAEADAEKLAEPCGCPLGRMEACEALAAAVEALARMPIRTRAAVVAHRLRGEPQKAIAERFGVSPTLVNFMLRDATAACRAAAEGPVTPPRRVMRADGAAGRPTVRDGLEQRSS